MTAAELDALLTSSVVDWIVMLVGMGAAVIGALEILKRWNS